MSTACTGAMTSRLDRAVLPPHERGNAHARLVGALRSLPAAERLVVGAVLFSPPLSERNTMIVSSIISFFSRAAITWPMPLSISLIAALYCARVGSSFGSCSAAPTAGTHRRVRRRVRELEEHRLRCVVLLDDADRFLGEERRP